MQDIVTTFVMENTIGVKYRYNIVWLWDSGQCCIIVAYSLAAVAEDFGRELYSINGHILVIFVYGH